MKIRMLVINWVFQIWKEDILEILNARNICTHEAIWITVTITITNSLDLVGPLKVDLGYFRLLNLGNPEKPNIMYTYIYMPPFSESSHFLPRVHIFCFLNLHMPLFRFVLQFSISFVCVRSTTMASEIDGILVHIADLSAVEDVAEKEQEVPYIDSKISSLCFNSKGIGPGRGGLNLQGAFGRRRR